MRVKSCTLVGFGNAISFILLGFAGYRDVQRLGGYPGERLRFLGDCRNNATATVKYTILDERLGFAGTQMLSE